MVRRAFTGIVPRMQVVVVAIVMGGLFLPALLPPIAASHGAAPRDSAAVPSLPQSTVYSYTEGTPFAGTGDGIAFDPQDGSFYAPTRSNSVAVFNESTWSQTATVALPAGSGANVAIDPTHELGFVNAGPHVSGVTMFNTSTGLVVRTVPTNVPSSYGGGVAVDPARELLVYTNGSVVTFVDYASWHVMANLPIPNSERIAIDPTDGIVAVSSPSDHLAFVNESTPRWYANATVIFDPDPVVYDPTSSSFVVGDNNGNNLSVVNALGPSLVANYTLPSGTNVEAIAVVGAGSDEALLWSYASGSGGWMLQPFEVDTGTFLTPFATQGAGFPSGLSIDPRTLVALASDPLTGEYVPFLPTLTSMNRVTFYESGLPAGSYWCTALNSAEDCGTGQLTFYEGSGTYAFSVGSSGAYSPSPPSGNITIGSLPLQVNIVFSIQPKFPVTFLESGLPAGTTWTVAVNGDSSSSTSNSITWHLPNGSYPYVVQDVSGWHQTTLPYSGNVDVTGSSVTEPTLLFARVTYPVAFAESGLPSNTQWWVNLTGPISLNGTTSSLSLTLGNGTYTYSVASVDKDYQGKGGTVTVTAAPETESISFVLLTYAITFSEAGLPSGTTWNVTLGNVSHTSVSGPILFASPNGSYAYTVDPELGYNATPSSGLVNVSGHALSVPTIQFTSVPLTIYSYSFAPATVVLGGTTYINVTAAGGTPGYTYRYSGLPTPCLNSDVNKLVCDPNEAGTFAITVTVTDAAATSVSATANLTVQYPPLVITNASASPASVPLGQSVTLLVSESGGKTPYTFAYSALPPGCQTANATTLNCTPTWPGSYNITVWVNDTVGQSAQGHVLFTVTGTPPSPLVVSLHSNRTSVTSGMPFSLSISASGGTHPYAYVWQLNGTNDSLAPTTSIWNLSLPHPGNYSYRAWVSDILGQLAHTAWVNVTVTLPGSPGGGRPAPSNPWSANVLGIPLWAWLAVVLATALLLILVWFRRRSPGTGTRAAINTPASGGQGPRSKGDSEDSVPAPPARPPKEDWDEEEPGNSNTIVLNTPSGERIAYDANTGAVLAHGRPMGPQGTTATPQGDEQPGEVNPDVPPVDPAPLPPLGMRVTPEADTTPEFPPELAPPSERRGQKLVDRAPRTRVKRSRKPIRKSDASP